jgi:hypothetical protein
MLEDPVFLHSLGFTVKYTAIIYLWVWFLDPGVGLMDKVLRGAGLTDRPLLWLSTPGRALLAVAIVIVWKTVGFTRLLLTIGLQGIPTDRPDAANVDGAGRYGAARARDAAAHAADARARRDPRVVPRLRPVPHPHERRPEQPDADARLLDLRELVRELSSATAPRRRSC